MDLYFFLDNEKLNPAITVSNFAPSGIISRDEGDCYICFAYPENGKWHLDTHMKMMGNVSETINWQDLGVERTLIKSTLVFLSRDPLNVVVDVLPEIKYFESVPSWRANLKIIGCGTSVSYQGEYPYNMTKIKGGSIISLVPLIKKTDTIKNYIFYPSFSDQIISKEGQLIFASIKTKKQIAKFKVFSNRVNCIDISSIDTSNDQLILKGIGIMGIPVYFSEDQGGKRMSLEHAMAPSEYSILGDLEVRRRLMQRMKSFWS